MDFALPNRPRPAAGLRSLAALLNALADRLDGPGPAAPTPAADEYLFDSDAYLADVRNRVFTHYY